MGFGAVLIMSVATSETMRATMSLQPLRTLGKYSYAIYVFQAPVQHVMVGAGARPERIGYLMFMLVGISVTLGLAFASWHLWEVHFLRLRRYGPAVLRTEPAS